MYEVIYPSGDIYVGGMQTDMRSGTGNFLWRESGDLFRGQWLLDRREGVGVLKFGSSGRVLTGHWVNDVCVLGTLEQADGEMPELKLKDAAALVAAAEENTEVERRMFRAKNMPVEEVLPGGLLAEAVKLVQANKVAFKCGGSGRRVAIQAVVDALKIEAVVTDEEAKDDVMRVVAVAYAKSRS